MSEVADLVSMAETFETDGFTWESKYPGAYDLRPAPSMLDRAFVDVLGKNNIPQLLSDATQHDDLVLIHCQVRRVKKRPNNMDPSYMNWHRDTYLSTEGKWVGNTPAVHKLILYPNHGDRNEERLAVMNCSHRMAVEGLDIRAQAHMHTFSDELFKNASGGQVNGPGFAVIHADNTKGLLFDTSLMHAVIPEVHDEGSIRIIYSFATRRQYREIYSDKQIHRHTYSLYEEVLNG